MMKMRCLVVDDEPLAREGLEGYVRQVDFLKWVGSCENAIQANSMLQQQETDLMLLDIHMPEINGIDFLKDLRQPPQVIFTTAYPNFALEGYTLNVTDYLVKPLSFNRFLQAVNKAYELYRLRTGGTASSGYIFIKCDNRYEKIELSDILYVEGTQNYVTFHTATGRHITYLTMKNVEEQLPASGFIRPHKSFIVAESKITAIEGNELVVQNRKIPISRERREHIFQRLMQNRMLKRG